MVLRLNIKKQVKKIKRSKILIILFIALAVRLLLAPFGTLELDFNTFIAWSQRLVGVGFGEFYKIWSDYLPGYLYVLWFLGWVQRTLPIPQALLFKLPAILSDVVTGFLIYVIVKRFKDKKWGLIASAVYLFNPAVLANSTLWGQVDSLTVLFALLTIWLVDKKLFASSLALALGTLVKPQVALVAPVVFFVMLRQKWQTGQMVKYVFFALLIFVSAFVPFSVGKSLLPFIFERITTTLNQYQYTSVNAFNFWGLFGFWKPEGRGILSAQVVGLAIAVFVSLLAALKLWKKKAKKYLLMAVVFISSFIFFTRMHERHLLPGFAFLAIASSLDPILWVSYIGFSTTYLANLYYSFSWITENFVSVFSPLFIKILILSNLGFLGLVFSRVVKTTKLSNYMLAMKKHIGDIKRWKKSPERKDKRKALPGSTARILLVVILSFSFLGRIAWLGSPKDEYFDEVYHAFTARRMLHGDPKAWEWWNTPPEGFAYEWTHPPLAKEGMILGMLIFGENAFGWRVPGAILGVGAVYLVYLIAKKLFKDEVIGLISSAVFALDGLPLVMSRIGMNDLYFLFFTLLAIYLYIKEKNFFSSLALGLAAASKWSTVWAIPIFGVAHFVLKRKFKISYTWFLILPPLVYLASYIPMFLTGHDFNTFIGVQKQMWWYHTRLSATHPFTSPWWSWPILLRPIWLYTSGVKNGFISNVYAMGNPLVFWAGLVLIGFCFFYFLVQRNKTLGLVVFSYVVFFVPWAVSPRIMFLYHYLPSIPFLAIATGYMLRKRPRLISVFLFFGFLVFIYFYPRWTGLAIPINLDNSYHWFSSW